MYNIGYQIILILTAFILTGCCATKKSDVTATTPVYQEFKKISGNKVYFTFDSSALSKTAKEILIKQAEWLKANPNTIADIQGHCDEIGTEKYNFALGLKRAESVKNFLKEYGVNQERLSVISYGKLYPEKSGHTKEDHRINRRVVTIVIK